ncbi:MAG: FHA domain-containing protein [Anaerolineae bacterium]
MQCKNCAQENFDDSLFCDKCGVKLTVSAPPAESPLPVTSTPGATVTCKVCGTANKADNEYCENCGAGLDRAAPSLPSSNIAPSAYPSSSAGSTASAGTAPVQNVSQPIVTPPVMMPPPVVTPRPAAPPPSTVTPPPVVTRPPEVNSQPRRQIGAIPASQPPQPGHPRLVLTASRAYFDISGFDQLVIGRTDPESGIYPEIDLTTWGGDDAGVSRRHCIITRGGNLFFIQDMSANGTWINDRRLQSGDRTPLNGGERLTLGHLQIEFFS